MLKRILLIALLCLVALPAAADNKQPPIKRHMTRITFISWNKSDDDPVGYVVYRVTCGKEPINSNSLPSACNGLLETIDFTTDTSFVDVVDGPDLEEYFVSAIDEYLIPEQPVKIKVETLIVLTWDQ